MKVISYYTVCSMLKKGQCLAPDIFSCLCLLAPALLRYWYTFLKHLFAIARALLSSVLSLLAFFKVGKNSHMALDLKDCWFATNFFLFRSQCFSLEESASSLYFKHNFASFSF